MTNIEQREQLMENISSIVDDFFYEKYNGDIAESAELTRILCDAVCKNYWWLKQTTFSSI